MERQMLRATLDKLKKVDALLECDIPVDRIYELGAVSSYFNNKVPILFNKVTGGSMRTISGLYGNRELVYYLTGLSKENRVEKITRAITQPAPYKVVDAGPVQQNILRGNIDLDSVLPINRFHKKDSSKFITAGVLVIRDPETGKIHTSVRRLQYNGNNNLSVLVASRLLTDEMKKLAEKGKDLDAAVVLGYDAEYLIASQISSELYGQDKNEVDSALRGEPLELVRCQNSDLLVPAYAEIVLEGKIVTGGERQEGPFGELMGYYGECGPHPYLLVETVTHRDDPIYETAFPCVEEHFTNGVIREAELFTHLKNVVDVLDVNVSEGGGYRFNAYVSIRKRNEGDGKSAILAALGLNKDLKHVVIVDPDVDIYDLREIEWAIATRSQASSDYAVVNGALGSGLEASHLLRGVTDKVGIDATAPLGTLDAKFERCKIPGFETVDILKYFPGLA